VDLKNIVTQDTREIIFGVLYIFAAYFAGSYISTNYERFADRIAYGDLSHRLITRLLRLIALYLIVSSVLSLVISIVAFIWLAFYR
jgi:hypothetical protein